MCVVDDVHDDVHDGVLHMLCACMRLSRAAEAEQSY